MTGYVTGPDNELLSDSTWNYTYDAVGNMTGKVNIATGESWTYTYDDANHMTGAEQFASDGTVLMNAVYRYDVFGNRIETDVWTAATGTVTTRYAMDGWNGNKPALTGNENWDVWAVMDGNNHLLTRYINGDGVNQVFARVDSKGVAWLLTDALGSTRDVISNTGALLDHIDYDAFGNITYQLNAAYGGNILFTGDQYDSETGFYFSRARYLNPTTGRWTTQDPMGLVAGDSNLYRYAGNDPTNYADPSGNVTDWIWFVSPLGGVTWWGFDTGMANGPGGWDAAIPFWGAGRMWGSGVANWQAGNRRAAKRQFFTATVLSVYSISTLALGLGLVVVVAAL